MDINEFKFSHFFFLFFYIFILSLSFFIFFKHIKRAKSSPQIINTLLSLYYPHVHVFSIDLLPKFLQLYNFINKLYNNNK